MAFILCTIIILVHVIGWRTYVVGFVGKAQGARVDDNLTRFDDFLASFYEIGGTFNDNLKSFPDELTIGRF